MLVKVNNKECQIPDGISLFDLVRTRNLPEKLVIIELNGELVQKENWAGIKVNSNDCIELIQILGGG
jgi:sulfur carrier protein